MALKRRQVLKGAASLSALSLLKPLGARAAEKKTAIVVGGGLSGLYSAMLLKDAGMDVVVLEGANRIGGRVYTADGVETRPEFGASQVGRSYARLINLCARFNLNLVKEHRDLMPMSNYIDQTWVSSKQWSDSPLNKMKGDEREIPAALVGTKLLTNLNPLKDLDDWLDPKFFDYDVSVLELFKRHGVSDAAIKLASVTTDIHKASALALLQEKTRTQFDATFGGTTVDESMDRPYGFANEKLEGQKLARVNNIEGGASRLPEAMADYLGDSVHMNKVVREIDMGGSNVEVSCMDGSRYKGDFVVSSLPFSTLKYVNIYPQVQGPQADAIFQLDYADTTRAFGMIEEPFWDDGFEPSFFTDETIQMFWALEQRPDEDKYRFMVVFTEPSAARIDQLSTKDALTLIESEINRIRPSTKGKLTFYDMYGWKNNDLVQGCRHMFSPGQVSAFAREMIEPHHRLHFAGEHTRRNDFGMESALESGERVAFEILTRA